MSDGREHGTFEQRLAAAQAAARAVKRKRTGVAAMAIAVLLGWGLDRLFHTRPWIMVAMVPVGMAAGLRNLVRAVGPAGK